MTGGRAQARARATSATTTFCCTYGDGVADVDIGALVAFHRAHGKLATVTAVQPAGALRRAGRSTATRVDAASPRSRTATAAGSTAASSCFDARVLDDSRRRRDLRPGARAAGAARRRRRARASTATTASGSAMDTLRDVELLRGAVGPRATRRGAVWDDRSGAAPIPATAAAPSTRCRTARWRPRTHERRRSAAGHLRPDVQPDRQRARTPALSRRGAARRPRDRSADRGQRHDGRHLGAVGRGGGDAALAANPPPATQPRRSGQPAVVGRSKRRPVATCGASATTM